MCGLYGVIANKDLLSVGSLVYELGCASTVRGTDATGVAYLLDNKMEIEKASKAAYNFRVDLPKGTTHILGHTRRTTQGSAKQNYNNHPFRGLAGRQHFALAHNGVIYNETDIRSLYQLGEPKIKTDSYVAVQILEHLGGVCFDTLKEMAEALEGMFTITILESDGTLWIVRHDNPITVLDIEGSLVYASTPEILMGALAKWDAHLFMDMLTGNTESAKQIEVQKNEIVRIKDGEVTRQSFEPIDYYAPYYGSRKNISWFSGGSFAVKKSTPAVTPVVTPANTLEGRIRDMADTYGVTEETVDDLLLFYDHHELLSSLFDGTVWDYVMLMEEDFKDTVKEESVSESTRDAEVVALDAPDLYDRIPMD